MAEIQELKAECSGYRERLEKIKSATNHVTPEEKEKVFTTLKHQLISYFGSAFLVQCGVCCNLQVYKERDVYVKEWKKRKRLVVYFCQQIN